MILNTSSNSVYKFFLHVVITGDVHDRFSCSFQHSTAPSSDKFIHSLSLIRRFCQDSVFVTYPEKGAHTDENDHPADICQPISSVTSASPTTQDTGATYVPPFPW